MPATVLIEFQINTSDTGLPTTVGLAIYENGKTLKPIPKK